MCLRFVFILVVRLSSWLRLSRRGSAWKDVEILLLRHQVALLERHCAARPKLTWADRALFAALLAVVPRVRHAGLRLPVMPATILRWHRDLVKRRWAAKSRPKRPGRPRRHPTIARLVLRMARHNENGGYRRITGELAGLGITVAPSMVWGILEKHGINRRRVGVGRHGRSFSVPRLRRSSRATSLPWICSRGRRLTSWP
jgi:hypothetical protein